jgi:Spy/CpxP family protein refolding chaperone
MTSTPSLRALTLMVVAGLVACTVGFAAASAAALGPTLITAQAGTGTAPDAQPAPGQKRYGHWPSRLKQDLALTDDQASQIGQVFQRSMQTARPHYQAIRAARAELRRLVLTEADQASIQAKEAELQQLLARTVQMRVQTLKEITPILSPEQREKFAQMEQGGRFGGHHRRHRQPPASGQS